jgi:hypothetical protein
MVHHKNTAIFRERLGRFIGFQEDFDRMDSPMVKTPSEVVVTSNGENSIRLSRWVFFFPRKL